MRNKCQMSMTNGSFTHLGWAASCVEGVPLLLVAALNTGQERFETSQ